MFDLDGYRIEATLHEGARSTVYRARRRADNTPVIIKTVSSTRAVPAQQVRFSQTHKLLSSLTLRGVPSVVDYFVREGRPFMVLEDIGGESLQAWLQSGRLDRLMALKVGAQIASILDALHRRQIIHRDVKTANVVLDQTGTRVQLIDFELATRGAPEPLSPDEEPQGTLAYISPEQTGRQGKSVDHRADLYSLGVTLFELLTGQLPFTGKNTLAILHAHLAIPAPRLDLVDPTIPLPVTELVARLLAKNPEERYQSAFGLQHDLTQCAEELERTGGVTPFSLGSRDASTRLPGGHRLIGRETELRVIDQALQTIGEGPATLLLVTGPAGAGKSSVIAEAQRRVAPRIRFAQGKFDALRNEPCGAFLGALARVVRRVLAQPDELISGWKSVIGPALGNVGQVLVDVLPDLALIIGPQPEVAELPAEQARNRFNLVVHRFIKACCEMEPLVLVLDDLQWADASSLHLILHLLLDLEPTKLLIIGAYRDNEVSESLDACLVALESRPIIRLPLAPLDSEEVRILLDDTVGADASAAGTELIRSKAGGNPFFIWRFLHDLQDDGALSFDLEAGRWKFDLARANHQGDDDVGAMMDRQLSRLAPATRARLMAAACLGSRFELTLLATLTGDPIETVSCELWPAIEVSLVESTTQSDDVYRFAHDRVFEAARRLASKTERQRLHLHLGRLILKSLESLQSERLLEAVDQLNLGWELMESPEERLMLAELNLTAGKRAMAATAFDVAARYLEAGIQALPEGTWRSHHQLTFFLVRHAAEAHQMAGSLDKAEARFTEALAHAEDLSERCAIHRLRIILLNSQGRYTDSVQAGLEGLALFGFQAPTTLEGWQAITEAESLELKASLADRAIDELVNSPAMTDPDLLLQMGLFGAISAPAALQPHVLPFIILRQCNLSIRHGNAAESAMAFTFSGYLSCVMDDYQTGLAFGRMAIELAERRGAAGFEGPIQFLYGCYIRPWRFSIESCLTFADRGHRLSLEAGRFDYAGWSAMQRVWLGASRGLGLAARLEEAEAVMEVFRSALHYEDMTRWVIGFVLAITRLAGRDGDRAALERDGFGEQALIKSLAHYGMAAGAHRIIWMQTAYVLEEYEEAAAHYRAILPLLPVLAGHISLSEYALYGGLTLCVQARTAPPKERAAQVEAVKALLERLTRFAELCPENHGYKAKVLRGELAALEGSLDAVLHFEDAAHLAATHGFPQGEALACERAAAFFLEQDRPRAARGYLTDAHNAYLRWGASAKTAKLEARFPWLGHNTNSAFSSLSTVVVGVDVETLHRASRAISREVSLDSLLRTVCSTLVQNAGATRGVMLLSRPDGLRIEARVDAPDGVPTVLQAEPLSERAGVAISVVRFVERTRQPVVLADARRSRRFGDDPHVRTRSPRSILGMPILNQTHLLGVLYLENELIPDAFSQSRCQVLEMLSAQVAVSIENARLWADLEARVQIRTTELAAANRELETFNYTLSHDLKAPIRTIHGFSQALSEDYQEALGEDGQHYLDRILRACERMERLVDDILELSKVQHTALSPKAVDLSLLARRSLETLMLANPERKVSSSFESDLWVQGDPQLLQVVMDNLIGNAWKYTGHEPEPLIELKRGAAIGQFLVTDNGVGFDAAEPDDVFKPFFRLHGEAEFPGTGIGLATVRRVIDRHGGSIHIQSRAGAGTTITFQLPVP